jgi:hypothetical protein
LYNPTGNPIDITKYVQFDASSLTTGRVLSLPDAAGTIATTTNIQDSVSDASIEPEVTPYSASVSGTYAIDVNNGSVQKLTCTGPTTFSFTNSDALKFTEISVHVVGGQTHGVIWPASFFVFEAEPTMSNSMLIEIVSVAGTSAGKAVALDVS